MPTKTQNTKQPSQTPKQTRQPNTNERQDDLVNKTLNALKSGRNDHVNGAFLAVLGPIAGALVWLGIWRAGFIAGIAAYAMVRLTIWLYQKGAGSDIIDRPALYIILGYTVLGLALAFFASFTSDSIDALIKQYPNDHLTIASLLTSSDFWSWNFSQLGNTQVLGGYTTDFIIAIALSGLGLYGTIQDVLLPGHRATKQAKTQLAQSATNK